MPNIGSVPKYTLNSKYYSLKDYILFYCPFDGSSPPETNFDVNLIPISGVPPTIMTGGLIGRTGKWGKGVQCAEATTNMWTNPSLETNITGFSSTIAPATLSRVHETAKFGTYCLKTVTPGAGIYEGWSTWPNLIPIVAGQKYTLSLYAKGTPGDFDLRIIYEDAGGFTVLNNLVICTLTTDWKLFINCPSVVAPPTAVNAYFDMRTSHWFEVTTLYVDCVQFENKAYPTPYCDGSLGTGHAWTSVAHASTSTRTATSLNYPLTMPSGDWSISFWLNPITLPSETSVNTRVILWRFDDNNLVRISYNATIDRLELEYISAGVSTLIGAYDLVHEQNYNIVIIRQEIGRAHV